VFREWKFGGANMSNEVWQSIRSELPDTPTQNEKAIPIPEMLRVIEFCLQPGVEKFDTALQLTDMLAVLRNDLEFLNWKAMVEYDAKAYKRAFETATKVLEIAPSAEFFFNAGRAAYKANELEKSKEYYEQALQLNGGDSSTILDYSITLCSMGSMDEALNLITSIDSKYLDEKTAKIVEFNKGWHLLRHGDFKKGMACLHIGRTINIWGSDARKYDRPKWDGILRPGATILISGEAGIGDEVINARFSKIIQDRGMRAVMSTVHKNVKMLKTVPWLDDVFNAEEIEAKQWDFWAPCMDLPYILDIDASDIPSEPYLTPKPEYVSKWSWLQPVSPKTKKKLKVGIRWKGNPLYELELHRTVSVDLFQCLACNQVELYSIQLPDGDPNHYVPKYLTDLSKDLKSWDDTMGCMANLDLVITSCTSVAHVAAAMGVRTWVMVPLLPYYVWADMKDTSYWYDSVRVFRQKRWRSWIEPVQEVKSALLTLIENEVEL
jgi:tetratricopeptide (TPR) repeat protein